MSQRGKTAPAEKRPPTGVASGGLPMTAVVLVALLVLAGSFGLVVWWIKPPPREAPSAAVSPPASPGPDAATAAGSAEFQKLKGRWLRPDGGYLLEISEVNAAGKMEASYRNPSPIHVAKAEASRDGAKLKVFVELQDVNYPGSTYTLTYDPASEQLQGIYFQAALNEQYEVFFERQK
jgi:hypothetical protein